MDHVKPRVGLPVHFTSTNRASPGLPVCRAGIVTEVIIKEGTGASQLYLVRLMLFLPEGLLSTKLVRFDERGKLHTWHSMEHCPRPLLPDRLSVPIGQHDSDDQPFKAPAIRR